MRDLQTFFPTDDGTVRAVDGVDLDVQPGECLGVVGESGSGKSVTFASVMGLVRKPGTIAGGSIRFDGRELRDLAPSRDAPHARPRDRAHHAGRADRAQSGLDGRRADRRSSGARMAACRRPRGTSARLEMLRLVGIPEPERRLGSIRTSSPAACASGS